MFFLEASFSRQFCYLLVMLALVYAFSSCSAVKNYPVNKPFVYKTNIELKGKFNTDDRKTLLLQLEQQLDDSLKTRYQQRFLIINTLKNPAVYDSIYAGKSIAYMQALLRSLGYSRDSITFTNSVAVKGDQQRTTITFYVQPGKLIRLDSVWYTLSNDSLKGKMQRELDTLQYLTDSVKKDAFIKKGEPFSKSLISSERDRLADVYRNNGYLRFSQEDLIAVFDTVGLALLRPTLDPIEQALQLQALRRRRDSLKADVEMRLTANADSNHLKRYYIGNTTVYTDVNEDTALYAPSAEILSRYGYRFVSYQGLFNNRKLIRYIYLRRGEVYRQSNYLKTQNKFNSLGAWRLVTVNPVVREKTDSVDFEIKLVPAKKYLASAIFEASKNTGNILSEGNLIGLGLTLGLQNRNFARAANLATTNFRGGVEFNAASNESFVQTKQISLTHTIQFPRLVPRLKNWNLPFRENARTFLSFNVGNTDRKDYYNITSFNTSWGYEFGWSNKLLRIQVPNIEYNFLTRRQRLLDLINTNNSYRYIFNAGLVTSTIASLRIAKSTKNFSQLLTIGGEVSGLIGGRFRNSFLDSNLFQFIKSDIEFKQTYKFRRNALAWRIFGGVGYELPSSHNRNDQYLPFFKQYFAGGPNSMRAWGVRRLGPGSTVKSFEQNVAPDRFGDMRLELNGEYRFHIFNWLGFNFESALYTDIGNVWFIRKNDDFPNGEFRLKNLWKDIAIGTGTGLRVDFGFLKVRLDYAYKVKDPSTATIDTQNKWFYNWKPFNGQFQLGIDYPF